MLFQTRDELTTYLSRLTASFDFDQISPDIQRAEDKYIIPLLSQDEYDDLNAAYNAGTMNAKQEALLPKVQLPLAYLAFMLFRPKAMLQFSNSGIHIKSNDNIKIPFEYNIRDLDQSLAETGYDGLDTMLYFLEANSTDYPFWAGSDSFTEYRQYFLYNTSLFQKEVDIRNSRQTFVALLPEMKKVEKLIILPILGDYFYDEIRTAIVDDSATADQQKVIDYIRPAIAYLTVSRAINQLSVQIRQDGIIVNNLLMHPGKREVPADQMRLGSLQKKFHQDGQGQLNVLVQYLNKSASASKYATYFNSDLYIDPDDDTANQPGFQNTSDSKIFGMF